MRAVFAVLMLFLVPVTPVEGQETDREEFVRAYELWDSGKYPDAVRGFQAILSSPGSERHVESIALLTGELYATEEIARDGNSLSWSGDGRYASYATGSLAEGTAVRNIVTWDDGVLRRIGELRSVSRLAFAPDDAKIVYLMVPDDVEIDAARTRMAELRAARDFAGWRSQATVVRMAEAARARLITRDLVSGRESEIELTSLSKIDVKYSADGNGLFVLGSENESATRLFRVTENGEAVALTDGAPPVGSLAVVPGGRFLLYSAGEKRFGLHDLSSGNVVLFDGWDFAVSADGSTCAYLGEEDGLNTVNVIFLNQAHQSQVIQRTDFRLDAPALSPDGSQVVYQMRPREDWDLFVTTRDGSETRRLTNDVQHDLFPEFMDGTTVLGITGEGRHRRSFKYDVETGIQTRLFHNNTIRTVAPEYEWAVSPDGSSLLIVSERDGDTISPERGVYRVDLTRKLTADEISRRLETMLAAELDLRDRGQRMYEIINDEVQSAVSEVSISRLYGYARDLHSFGTKYIGEPGNGLAISYLAEQLQSYGYEVEQQWFEPRAGIKSANVIATLKGTVDPDLVYVISSHFDSSRRGPGADDNSSGTTVLLETARILADRPQAATIKFAFFTGEEAGLLGSRYYVKKAVEDEVNLVGALNNDMVGWTNNHRLDDTIRYSNAGIRDVQHAAAFLFSNLITYDAKYYKSTDAHAYYDEYGDIVGGIGSYPILSSPHYHQSHDVLEIINHQLVTEVSKTTIGTIMLLASSPSRLINLDVTKISADQVELAWQAAVESEIDRYVVSYGPISGMTTVTVSEPRVTLTGVNVGDQVRVKAINSRGLAGWDWARDIIE